MIFIVLFTLLVAYVIHFYMKVAKYPKGPFPLPLIGNMYQMDQSKVHEDIGRFAEKYGKLFTVWFMDKPVVYLCSYENQKEALVTNADALINRTREPLSEVTELVENAGVAFSNGDNWHAQRKTAVQILKDLGVGKNVLEEMIHRELAAFFTEIETNHSKDGIDFDTPIQIATANIIHLLLFGYANPYDKSEQMLAFINDTTAIMNEAAQSVPLIVLTMLPQLRRIPMVEHYAIGKYKERFRKSMVIIENNVQQALNDFSEDDDATCFVQAYSQKIGSKEFLDNPNLQNICYEFFLAGVDAANSMLRWSLLYFVKYPEIQIRIRREIADVVGFSRFPSMNDRPKMPQTQSIMLEIQRHSNIFPFNIQRETIRDITVTGIHIPAKTAVMQHIYENLHDKDIYENPKEFIIDRFLSSDGKSVNQNLANKMLLFGAGRRSCTGEGLAKAELFLFTTAFIQKYQFSAPNNGMVNMEAIMGLSLQPKKHLLRIAPVNVDMLTDSK